MIEIDKEIINATIIAGVYIGIFIIGELIHRGIPSKPEISRKSVHFLGGITALLFPYIIKSHWTVLALAVSFAFIIIVTKKKGILRSVHGIERISLGSIWFPISIYLVFLLGHTKPVIYFTSILVMTISDALAALVGEKYGTIKFDVEGNIKSLEGSTIFFFVTFLCVHLSLLLMTQIGRLQSVLIALVIAILVTGFEAISLSGSDNLFVPLGTYYILAKMTKYPLPETIRLVQLLFLIILITSIIFWRVKAVKWSGVIGMILLNYAAWTLCGFRWFLPLFLSEIVFLLVINLFKRMTKEETISYHIKAVLYTAIIPIGLIFVTNTLDNQRIMYLPFLASNVSQTALMSGFLFCKIFERKQLLNSKKELTIGFMCSILSVVIIGLLPIFLYLINFKFASILILCVAVFLAYGFNFLISKFHYKMQSQSFKDPTRFRIRLLSTAVCVIFVFVAQLLMSM